MVPCSLEGPRTKEVWMLKADDWSFLRRLHEQEGKSIRWIAKEFDMSRKTVAKHVRQTSPPRYAMSKPRSSPVMEPVRNVVIAILEADKSAPVKQRHTGKRIYDRLVAEHDFKGGESTVRQFVTNWRKGQVRPKIFIPLQFAPGSRAQVDFGEIYACLDCKHTHLPWELRASACSANLVKLQCFVMRLCYSRRVFAMCLPSANMVGFIAAHKLAFEHFGSRPKELVYDNLTLAVRKVLKGHNRELTKPFEHLIGYYGFGYHFCKPGKDGAHEKGGVESGVGFIRRNWFVPVPHVKDLAELNAYLQQRCLEDMARTVDDQPQTIGQAWECESQHTAKLPATGIDACVIEPASFDDYGMVRYDKNFYSIPDTIATSKLWIRAYWDHVEITDGTKVVARHARCYGSKERTFEPEHYFQTLERRPGAVGFAQPLLKASWPSAYWRFFEDLKLTRGPSVAGKEFVRLLRLHNQYGAGPTVSAVTEATAVGALAVDAIKSIILANVRPAGEAIKLDMKNREHLADYDVIISDLSCYQLLTEEIANDTKCIA